MNGWSAPSKIFLFLHVVNPFHRLVWPQREIQRFDWVCLDQTFGSLFETWPLWFASPSVVPSAPACRLIKSLITSALITAYYHQPNWLSYLIHWSLLLKTQPHFNQFDQQFSDCRKKSFREEVYVRLSVSLQQESARTPRLQESVIHLLLLLLQEIQTQIQICCTTTQMQIQILLHTNKIRLHAESAGIQSFCSSATVWLSIWNIQFSNFQNDATLDQCSSRGTK